MEIPDLPNNDGKGVGVFTVDLTKAPEDAVRDDDWPESKLKTVSSIRNLAFLCNLSEICERVGGSVENAMRGRLCHFRGIEGIRRAGEILRSHLLRDTW